MPDPAKRYFLDQDNSCHWYIIPADKRDEWSAWCNIPEDDARSWEAPAFAKSIGGNPAWVTFTDPKDGSDV